MEISVYLTLGPLEQIVPRLLEKVYAVGERCLMRVSTPPDVALWDKLLWTYGQKSFLPHSSGDDPDADQQPIWITCDADNPNASTVYVTIQGAPAIPESGFSKGVDIICVVEEGGLLLARQRIKEYTQRNQNIKIWKQTPEGKWERDAPAAGGCD